MNTPEERDKNIVKPNKSCIVAYDIQGFSINGIPAWGKLRRRMLNGLDVCTVEFPRTLLDFIGLENDLCFKEGRKLIGGRKKNCRIATGRIWRK